MWNKSGYHSVMGHFEQFLTLRFQNCDFFISVSIKCSKENSVLCNCWSDVHSGMLSSEYIAFRLSVFNPSILQIYLSLPIEACDRSNQPEWNHDLIPGRFFFSSVHCANEEMKAVWYVSVTYWVLQLWSVYREQIRCEELALSKTDVSFPTVYSRVKLSPVGSPYYNSLDWLAGCVSYL